MLTCFVTLFVALVRVQLTYSPKLGRRGNQSRRSTATFWRGELTRLLRSRGWSHISDRQIYDARLDDIRRAMAHSLWICRGRRGGVDRLRFDVVPVVATRCTMHIPSVARMHYSPRYCTRRWIGSIVNWSGARLLEMLPEGWRRWALNGQARGVSLLQAR